ncbi:DUF1569 domain-containing protein [Mangrovimonas aestuarii]|uniref:DUF1569 domain-containing protein n=1 Tax=Mangrovimonas aestuarii TaxID=3018443 RepID=UPI002379A46B|nr:DUF1569 domain-containing protein [Mangrovimonas aestuarii]
MKSLFERDSFNEICTRIESLSSASQPLWGKMSVGQMLKHCQQPLNVANGTLKLNNRAGLLKRLMFKLYKPLMYNDKLWKHNLPTVREFRVTDQKEFTKERAKLMACLDGFAQKEIDGNFPEHPYFGSFTKEQWGKMQYKHLDHHLRQFGV